MRWLLAQAQQKKNERAFVLPFLAVMIVVLLGITGFAVDIGNWYLHVQRAQKAADSAALSGAIYLPSNTLQAKAASVNQLKSNGFNGQLLANTPIPGHPTLMGVRVKETIDNQFLSLFGYKTFSFTRQAIAAEKIPLKMGSPSNVLGVEPDVGQHFASSTGFDANMKYSMNVAGRNGQINLGFEWSADNCVGPAPGTPPNGSDNRVPNFCTGPSVGQNPEYDPNQEYTVHVDPGTTGNMVVEVYDGTQSPSLDGGEDKNGLKNGDKLGDCNAPALATVFASTGNPLYKPTDYTTCEDDSYDATYSTTPNPTKFTLYNTDALGNKTTAKCATATFTPLPNDISANAFVPFLGPSGSPSGPFDPKNAFHNWAQICSISNPSGNYTLDVNNGDNAQYNSFKLRAYFPTGTYQDSKIRLYPKDKMTINAHGILTTGYTLPLVQLNQGSVGDTVTLKEFDVADATISDFKIAPASGGSIPCDFTTSVTGLTTHYASCDLGSRAIADGNSATWTFKLYIPAGYSCDWTNPDACWIVSTANYVSTEGRSDTSSWTVLDNGTPLHLYDDSKYTIPNVT